MEEARQRIPESLLRLAGSRSEPRNRRRRGRRRSRPLRRSKSRSRSRHRDERNRSQERGRGRDLDLKRRRHARRESRSRRIQSLGLFGTVEWSAVTIEGTSGVARPRTARAVVAIANAVKAVGLSVGRAGGTHAIIRHLVARVPVPSHVTGPIIEIVLDPGLTLLQTIPEEDMQNQDQHPNTDVGKGAPVVNGENPAHRRTLMPTKGP
ncbi:unnamed protein product [Protopolystoma xenopodis]|uniref:Uncharacterized protein n=1 Tax=Protopolystoma xenopodis TaxID=117903 RepID=A0A448XG71_9PLAT|nr:unnamed protein product [Protopolystoma xenopodis]